LGYTFFWNRDRPLRIRSTANHFTLPPAVDFVKARGKRLFTGSSGPGAPDECRRMR
jgi:hypothetical protein